MVIYIVFLIYHLFTSIIVDNIYIYMTYIKPKCIYYIYIYIIIYPCIYICTGGNEIYTPMGCLYHGDLKRKDSRRSLWLGGCLRQHPWALGGAGSNYGMAVIFLVKFHEVLSFSTTVWSILQSFSSISSLTVF